MATKRDLFAMEDAGWLELEAVLEPLTPQELEEIGYYPPGPEGGGDGWSVKDLLAHLGSWHAVAGQALERIRMGTYQPERHDVDAMNHEFYETNRDLPLPTVRAELWSARNRVLQGFDLLQEHDETAEEWFVESGSSHYAEHLSRLRQWAEELAARATGGSDGKVT
jgi:hypothetical protein